MAEPTTTPPKSPVDTEVEAEQLSNLLQHLQAIRSPNGPFRSHAASEPAINKRLRAVHSAAELFVRTLGAESVQTALRHATTLEESDPMSVVPMTAEERDKFNPKRRRIGKLVGAPSPGPLQLPLQILPPPGTIPDTPISLFSLPEYLRLSSKDGEQGLRLQIWSPAARDSSGTPSISSPVILKITQADVFIIYLTLVSDTEKQNMVIRKVVAFGPREKRLPHTQSEYSIFRGLSQVLSKVISDQPGVSLPVFLDMASSYGKLYTDTCIVCNQSMSREGHLPPLQRLWEAKPENVAGGRWVPRHVGCR